MSFGFYGGTLMAQRISLAIFGSNVTVQPVLFPVVMALAVVVTCAASTTAIRRAVKLDPAIVLRGDA